jgi:hypothetical protein
MLKQKATEMLFKVFLWSLIAWFFYFGVSTLYRVIAAYTFRNLNGSGPMGGALEGAYHLAGAQGFPWGQLAYCLLVLMIVVFLFILLKGKRWAFFGFTYGVIALFCYPYILRGYMGFVWALAPAVWLTTALSAVSPPIIYIQFKKEWESLKK